MGDIFWPIHSARMVTLAVPDCDVWASRLRTVRDKTHDILLYSAQMTIIFKRKNW